MADYWYVDVYRYYTDSSYARPRKIVDKLKLDWLDAGSMYCSPEVVFFNKEQLQERIGWTEEEVRLLFFDKRVPTCNFGRKEVIEVHALIEFFAKKERILRNQELYWDSLDHKEAPRKEYISISDSSQNACTTSSATNGVCKLRTPPATAARRSVIT